MWNPALAGADPTSAWVFFQNLAVAPPGCGGHFFLTALIRKRGCRQKGSEMRIFVASLIVLLVLYFWDRITTTAIWWMGSTACGEPSPTVCLIERGTGIPRNSQRQRHVIAGGVGWKQKPSIPHFFQDCLIFIGNVAVYLITENRFKHVSAYATQIVSWPQGAPIKIGRRWGSYAFKRSL